MMRRVRMPANNSTLKVTLLGTGTSTGIPLIGCDCAACTSDDPRDRRTRCSCYIEADGMGVLIDAGPDFRRQALRENIRRVDALLVTHHHFDHIVGLDDLRPLFIGNRRPIPCITQPETAAVFRRMFPYIFGEHPYPTAPRLALREVTGPFLVQDRYQRNNAHEPAESPGAEPRDLPDRGDPSDLSDAAGEGRSLSFVPVPLEHGAMSAYGYRIRNFAYLTDAHRIPDDSYQLLEGVDVLVLDALRERPHPSHFTFDRAIEAARRIGARETYFIHMTHDVVHADVDAALPEGVRLGYDGLSINID